MSISKTDALYWGGALALVAAAVTVAVRRGTTTNPYSIPDRWALLRQLHPDAQARFLALFRSIEAKTGGRVILTSGYRPTFTAGKQPAYHFFGLACDINVVLPSGKQLMMADTKATWEASGVPAIIRAAGFRWGGDFTETEVGAVEGDPVHVDLGLDYSIAALRAAATQLAFPKTLVGFDARQLRLAA